MNNNSAERENSRGLKPSEKRKGEKMFGNTINFDEVKIVDSGAMHAIVTFNSDLVVVHNKIYATRKMTDDELIHELYHVWAYCIGRIEPLTALGAHAVADAWDWISGRKDTEDDPMYHYRLEGDTEAEWSRLKDFNFEQQAAIFQDAYRYFYMGKEPEYNDAYRRAGEDETERTSPYWDDYYNHLIEDFQQWNRELPPTSCSSYMTYN